jgi:hypothetical protein
VVAVAAGPGRTVALEFMAALAVEVAGAVREASGGIIAAMRKEFSSALAVVKTAASVGITTTTNTDETVTIGNAKMMQSFRALPDAVAVLDRLAGLRDQLTQLADVGPWEYPAAAWLAKGASLVDIEAATEHDDVLVQRIVDDPFRRTVREVQHRTGGRWLALIAAGYAVRLNDGDEAHAVVAAAKAAETEPDDAA